MKPCYEGLHQVITQKVITRSLGYMFVGEIGLPKAIVFINVAFAREERGIYSRDAQILFGPAELAYDADTVAVLLQFGDVR